MNTLIWIATASLAWLAVAVVVGLFLGAVVHLSDERSLIGCPDPDREDQ